MAMHSCKELELPKYELKMGSELAVGKTLKLGLKIPSGAIKDDWTVVVCYCELQAFQSGLELLKV